MYCKPAGGHLVVHVQATKMYFPWYLDQGQKWVASLSQGRSTSSLNSMSQIRALQDNLYLSITSMSSGQSKGIRIFDCNLKNVAVFSNGHKRYVLRNVASKYWGITSIGEFWNFLRSVGVNDSQLFPASPDAN